MTSIDIENAIEEVDCVFGRIAIFRHDLYLGRSLREYGEWARRELDFLKTLIGDGSVVVDAGAFIGTHSIVFSSAVGSKGRVYAFEPHPAYFQVLSRNLASNNLTNVRAFNAGLTDQIGEMRVEKLDLDAPNSLGSARLGPLNSEAAGLRVKVTTLDDLRLDACHLIKLDVEGMEDLVLAGARETIERHKPFIYAECNSAEAGWPVVLTMRSLDYDVYLYSELSYNPDNFRKNPNDIFGRARELAIVCVPSGLEPASRPSWPTDFDIVPIHTLDDLVLCLIKKPQYKHEVLAHSNGARLWGNDFWRNEEELESERLLSRSELSEATKQIQVLTEWATSADKYGKSLLKELERTRAILESERADRQAQAADLAELRRATRWLRCLRIIK